MFPQEDFKFAVLGTRVFVPAQLVRLKGGGGSIDPVSLAAIEYVLDAHAGSRYANITFHALASACAFSPMLMFHVEFSETWPVLQLLG